MSSKYKIRDQGEIYFLTSAVVSWVDVFTREAYKEIVVQSLAYCQQHKGLILYAYCLMPNHIHLIAGVKPGNRLSDVLRDFKKFTSVSILQAIEQNPQESRRRWMLKIFRWYGLKNSNNVLYQFWQQDSHPVALTSRQRFNQRLHYIHQNPVRAGICYEAEDYVYSSAGRYAGKTVGLEVSFLE